MEQGLEINRIEFAWNYSISRFKRNLVLDY